MKHAIDIVTHCLTIEYKSCLHSDIDLDQKEDCFPIDLHQITEGLRGTIK